MDSGNTRKTISLRTSIKGWITQSHIVGGSCIPEGVLLEGVSSHEDEGEGSAEGAPEAMGPQPPREVQLQEDEAAHQKTQQWRINPHPVVLGSSWRHEDVRECWSFRSCGMDTFLYSVSFR